MVIVQDRAAFAAEFPWVPATTIADRIYTGNLDNAGETITLLDAGGGVLQRFTYDDVWYKSTDGDGYSLVVANPTVAKSAWNLAQGWQPSRERGGSPGEPDYLRGDFDGNNRVDSGDLAILQANLGTAAGASHAQGDMTRDGAVGRDDVAVFLSNFGDVYAPPVVPAPPAAVIRATAVDRALATLRAPRAARQSAPVDARPLSSQSPTLRARRTPRSHEAAFSEFFQ
jgi:hypothetical protein